MADVSLSTLPAAAPGATATAGTTGVDAAKEGATPFASLLTGLTGPAATVAVAKAGILLSPTVAIAVAADAPLLPDLSLAVSTDTPDVDGGDAVKGAGDKDATSQLAPDLSAFLAMIAPPPQIAPAPVRPVPTAPSPSATTVAGKSAPSIAATSLPQASAATTTLLQPSTSETTGAAFETPASAEPNPTEAPAQTAPDRMAPALAAIRAMATIVPAPLPTPAAAPDVVPTPQASSTPAIPAVVGSTLPAAQPVAAPSTEQAAIAIAPSPQADAIQNAPILPDTGAAPRAPDAATAPAIAPAARHATATATPTTVAASTASSEPQRPAPARTRRTQDATRVGDVRTEAAPARADVAALAQPAAPAAPADDPVARQLSIAHDGQWLDTLAKDIAGAGNANGQLNFRLDPDHLGSLTVQLTQTADGASVRLTASSDAARTILADAQPRLVAEARAQGLNLRDATIETRTAAPAAAPSANSNFGGNTGNSRSDQGGTSAQLQQQSQQQGGQRQRAPDQPARANPAPRAQTSTRSGADLYA